MNKYAKTGLALLLMVFVCCSCASGGAVENLNVTYQLGGSFCNAEAVVPTAEGGFYLGMANSSGAILLKTDEAGKEIWRADRSGDDVRTVIALEDGGTLSATYTMIVNGTETEGYT